MHGSYGFERYARPKLNAAIIIGGLATSVLFICVLCSNAGNAEGLGLSANKSRPDLIISGPFGEYKIYGADRLLAPVIEQGRMMNKIEAMENHNQFEHLSPNPEDYIK